MRIIRNTANYLTQLMAEMVNIEMGETYFTITADGVVPNANPVNYPTKTVENRVYAFKCQTGSIYVPDGIDLGSFCRTLCDDYQAYIRQLGFDPLDDKPFVAKSHAHTQLVVTPSRRLTRYITTPTRQHNYKRTFAINTVTSAMDDIRFKWSVYSSTDYMARTHAIPNEIYCDLTGRLLDDIEHVDALTAEHTKLNKMVRGKVQTQAVWLPYILLSTYWRVRDFEFPLAMRSNASLLPLVAYKDIAPEGLAEPVCAICDEVIWGKGYCVYNKRNEGTALCAMCAHMAPHEAAILGTIVVFKSPVSMHDVLHRAESDDFRELCVEFSKSTKRDASAGVLLVGDKYVIIGPDRFRSLAICGNKKYEEFADRFIMLC